MGLEFIEDRLDLPPAMISHREVFSRGLVRIGESGQEPIRMTVS